MSMGAFLKNSEKFLLLWDDTYVSRLWCMLEFAAFLKSHGPAAEESIVIRPMITAPCMLGFVLGTVLTLAIWVSVPRLTIPILLLIFATRLVGFYLAAGALREHYRSWHIRQARFGFTQEGTREHHLLHSHGESLVHATFLFSRRTCHFDFAFMLALAGARRAVKAMQRFYSTSCPVSPFKEPLVIVAALDTVPRASSAVIG